MEQNFEVVYDFANLYAAYRATRKGKRWKDSVAKVELNTLEAITVLQAELRDGLYKPEITMSSTSLSQSDASSRRTASRTKSCNTPFATTSFTPS